VLAHRLTTTHTQHFVCYICHLAQPGRKSSRIKVEDVLDNCMLFSRSKLLAIWSSLGSRGDSVEPIREPLVWNVKGCSSASQALKLACSIGQKSKIKSAPFLNSYRVVLLRHYVLRRKLVVPRKSGRLDGGIRYLINNILGVCAIGSFYRLHFKRLLMPSFGTLVLPLLHLDNRPLPVRDEDVVDLILIFNLATRLAVHITSSQLVRSIGLELIHEECLGHNQSHLKPGKVLANTAAGSVREGTEPVLSQGDAISRRALFPGFVDNPALWSKLEGLRVDVRVVRETV
jgi:hypothetical protein